MRRGRGVHRLCQSALEQPKITARRRECIGSRDDNGKSIPDTRNSRLAMQYLHMGGAF